MGSAFFNSRRDDCEQVEERLEAYVTGAMPGGEERSRIAAHLSECPSCRERVTEYTRISEALSSYRAAPLPERTGDWRMVRARLETASERRSGWGRPVFGSRAILTGVAAAMLGFVAVALPRLHQGDEAVTAPLESSTQQRRMLEAIPRGEQGSVHRVMEYSGVGEGKNTLVVAPTFAGGGTNGTVIPLVVEVGSDRDIANARLEVRPQRALDGHPYQYDVRLENGKSRFLVYPHFNPLRTDEGRMVTCEVTLTAPGRRQTVRLLFHSNNGPWPAMAYVGNRYGVISPRAISGEKGERPITPQVRPYYVAVENAPDKAIGYNRFSMLVLSPEAEKLNPEQWRAIREWVTAGGHLVFTSDRLLDIPMGRELSPVRKVVRNAFGTSYVPLPGAHEREARIPAELAQPSATITWRKWGMGTVYFTAFDPAKEEFRRWIGNDSFWEGMLVEVRSRMPEGYRIAAHHRVISHTTAASQNAFALPLPSVQFVLFLFLGYFVLVVPVTFAVLKHTRRLNMAWVTGPVLAVVFAGGIFLLTARLYFMPTARRTAGVLFLQSGERGGRFMGNTEIFFPKAGRYDLPVPQADAVETTLFGTDRERPMESRVNATGETTATLSVGNLAFRRVYHAQAVELPGAITVDLQPEHSPMKAKAIQGTADKGIEGGELVGYVENNTGKPLRNAILSNKFTVERRVRGRSYVEDNKVYIFQIGTLPPGRTEIRTTRDKWTPAEYTNADYLSFSIPGSGTRGNQYGQPMPQHLTLMAHTSGEPFGPRIGQDVSGEQSISLVVGVTAQKKGDK